MKVSSAKRGWKGARERERDVEKRGPRPPNAIAFIGLHFECDCVPALLIHSNVPSSTPPKISTQARPPHLTRNRKPH